MYLRYTTIAEVDWESFDKTVDYHARRGWKMVFYSCQYETDEWHKVVSCVMQKEMPGAPKADEDGEE